MFTYARRKWSACAIFASLAFLSSVHANDAANRKLFYAVLHGDIALALKALGEGADANFKGTGVPQAHEIIKSLSFEQYTADESQVPKITGSLSMLRLAVKNEDYRMLNTLLSAGTAKDESLDEKTPTAIMDCIAKNDLSLIVLLLSFTETNGTECWKDKERYSISLVNNPHQRNRAKMLIHHLIRLEIVTTHYEFTMFNLEQTHIILRPLAEKMSIDNYEDIFNRARARIERLAQTIHQIAASSISLKQ
jgi:hypothetical protein